MENWLNNPTFVVYAITAVVLNINLLFVWAYSGAAAMIALLGDVVWLVQGPAEH
jgi:preprotein translocase subunit SecF